MAPETFFITTAIDYTNAAPHIGHAYEKTLADVLARYKRQSGCEVFFLTGVDQHGQKVQQAAERENLKPQEFADRVTKTFTDLWKLLGISYDEWAATSNPKHRQIVQKILDTLYEAEAIYKAQHSGFYSVRQEQFLTDKERNEAGEFGPEWGEVVFLEEENWYFKLSECRDWLSDFVKNHKGFVSPAFRQAELANAVSKGDGDLCISRPKTRLEWGIELPFDKDFVTYVWFDALINYLSFAGYLSDENSERESFQKRWPTALHIIGKDILVPAHGVYWPCMLHAMGFSDAEMPSLLVHGWWTLRGAKVSKSAGNVIDPKALVEKYGTAAVRYYLVRDIATGQDSDFNEERLISIYNTELANGFGNLLNRTLNMAKRYRASLLQPIAPSPVSPKTKELLAACSETLKNYHEQMNAYQVHSALEALTRLVTDANTYAEQMAPWKIAKDETQAALLDETLTAMATAAATTAACLAPILPDEAKSALDQLQFESQAVLAVSPEKLFASPHQVQPPTPVFPRIDTPA
ncbi:MAG: class I tRNA ligase family protein [Chthoniobacterales bacterium]